MFGRDKKYRVVDTLYSLRYLVKCPDGGISLSTPRDEKEGDPFFSSTEAKVIIEEYGGKEKLRTEPAKERHIIRISSGEVHTEYDTWSRKDERARPFITKLGATFARKSLAAELSRDGEKSYVDCFDDMSIERVFR
jgi:hypothetical protein